MQLLQISRDRGGTKMRYKIQGENLPVVICALENGESMICEAGAMSWMSPNMEMETRGGGAQKHLQRL